MMKALSFCTAIFMLIIAAAAHGGEQLSVVANLEPNLQQVILHDGACVRPSAAAVENLLQVPVKTEEIRAAGREAGVIASPQDTCNCEGENCATFVYLKSGDSYRLALESKLASLHPMKIVKHGLPSLSGKVQVSPFQEETTVYDWNGQEYQPSLCATVIQRKNQRLPSISQHPCGRARKTVAVR